MSVTLATGNQHIRQKTPFISHVSILITVKLKNKDLKTHTRTKGL